MQIIDNQVVIEPPKRTKKITGTRFASILGLNDWNTDFQMWCEITKTYEKPFEDNIYTIAGKTIEPKQAQYMKNSYLMLNLKTPEDIYGKDYFKKTWGDFFKEHKVLGGMWDYILTDEKGKPTAVLEMKTTGRSEDWLNDVPTYYSLQMALYAYLLGVDKMYMVATFLEPKDYENPEKFEVNNKNTIVREYSLSKDFSNFQQLVDEVLKWHKNHVLTGISPKFDEKKDKDYLKGIRTNNVLDDDLQTLTNEIERLETEINEVVSTVSEKEKILKKYKDKLKDELMKNFRETDTHVDYNSGNFIYTVSKSDRETIDKKQLEKDNLLEKYLIVKQQYTLRKKECN